MAYEARKQSMPWMEMDLILKAYVFSMEGKMAAGALGCARNYGSDGAFNKGTKETRPSKEELDITVFVLLLGNDG